MNNMIWDAVLWLRKKLNKDKEDIIVAINNIQHLFETSADATASPSDILEGQTAYNGTVLLTGNMKDRRGITVTAGAVTQDENYTYLSIPEEACYNANSKLRTLNSNLKRLQLLQSSYPIQESGTINATSINGYNKLTVDNFILDVKNIIYGGADPGAYAVTKSYNQNTGILTISRAHGISAHVDVYVYA